MKVVIGAVAALLFAAVCWPQPASAQGVPRGSYLRSCGGVYMDGDTLIATCRRADGYEQQTALRGVHRCVGDIGNGNGDLTSRRGGEEGGEKRVCLAIGRGGFAESGNTTANLTGT